MWVGAHWLLDFQWVLSSLILTFQILLLLFPISQTHMEILEVHTNPLVADVWEPKWLQFLSDLNQVRVGWNFFDFCILQMSSALYLPLHFTVAVDSLLSLDDLGWCVSLAVNEILHVSPILVSVLLQFILSFREYKILYCSLELYEHFISNPPRILQRKIIYNISLISDYSTVTHLENGMVEAWSCDEMNQRDLS